MNNINIKVAVLVKPLIIKHFCSYIWNPYEVHLPWKQMEVSTWLEKNAF